ncbi:MAG TPA: HD domain-containing protein [Thermomicrobiales bacterium]|nr:HD domain-containing protein [Thermomicrobiales bacterium]
MALLSTALGEAFERLSRFDQAHLLAVRQVLCSASPVSLDLQHAALLHDIAKAGTIHQPGRVRLPHRVGAVVLRRYWPSGLERLARLPAPRWRAGFALAVHHPALGAKMAADLGCSARTCWLIHHHHDMPPPDDPELLLLIAADRDGA